MLSPDQWNCTIHDFTMPLAMTYIWGLSNYILGDPIYYVNSVLKYICYLSTNEIVQFTFTQCQKVWCHYLRLNYPIIFLVI